MSKRSVWGVVAGLIDAGAGDEGDHDANGRDGSAFGEGVRDGARPPER